MLSGPCGGKREGMAKSGRQFERQFSKVVGSSGSETVSTQHLNVDTFKSTQSLADLVDEILGHLAQHIRRYLGHSVRIFSDEPEYAGTSHRNGDRVRQFGHVTYDVAVCCRLHAHKHTKSKSLHD